MLPKGKVKISCSACQYYLLDTMRNSTISILINNESVSFPDDAGIKTVLDHLSVTDTNGLAVAVNGNVIPRRHWDDSKLKDNDEVIVIRATQGG